MTNEAQKPLPPAAIQRLQQERDNLWIALYTISRYQDPLHLRRKSTKAYGLESEAVIEYAYDNVRELAKQAIKGLKRPKG